MTDALLVLADGSEYEGEAIGALRADDDARSPVGELVFNTALSGYQEIVTDPSYAGQVITFTYPHIGNYGVNADDDESRRPFCAGRGRARPRHRTTATGAPPAASTTCSCATACPASAASTPAGSPVTCATRARCPARSAPTRPRCAPRSRARAAPTASTSSPPSPPSEPYVAGSDDAPFRVVAYDFGIKRTILRHLVGVRVPRSRSCRRRRPRPMSSPASRTGCSSRTAPVIPPAVVGAVEQVRGLVGEVPVFGICLGHQILGLALGADTYKLRFGHHGGNHPVRHEATGRVEITSQNHNYAVAADTLAGRVELTHVNLNDGVVEGFRVLDAPAFGVQHHPEAGPGPHDARYLFDDFTTLMTATSRKGAGRCPSAPTSRPSSSSAAARSSSARPASSTTRARRRAACCATRATASCW